MKPRFLVIAFAVFGLAGGARSASLHAAAPAPPPPKTNVVVPGHAPGRASGGRVDRSGAHGQAPGGISGSGVGRPSAHGVVGGPANRASGVTGTGAHHPR